eukprot:TRINITY_DN22880_c0_g1_i1.p1 TRINITY_DN22880_c0_g1~~TRINITY_DN22880_c0_g1_i1.p1  ORF type:complete len:1152 (+),score=273.25 TRINITY_DN22880_c0_g1_i1:71-3457(+)
MSGSPKDKSPKSRRSSIIFGKNTPSTLGLRKRGSSHHDEKKLDDEEERNMGIDVEREMEEELDRREAEKQEMKEWENNLKREWRAKEEIAMIINEPSDAFVAADFDDASVSQRVSEGILRNLKTKAKTHQDAPWWSTESEEVKNFRSLMEETTTACEQEWLEQHPNNTVRQARASCFLPKYIAAPLDPTSYSRLPEISLLVRFRENLKVTETASKAMTADRCLESFKSRVLKTAVIGPDERLVFKLIGKNDYVWGDTKLVDFVHIRKAILASTVVKLAIHIVEVNSTDESRQLVYKYDDISSTGSRKPPPAHQDISVDSCVAHMNSELSLWDMHTDTSLVIRSLSSITFTSEMLKEQKIRESDDVCVCVVGQLVHGTRQLAPPQATPWRVIREAVPAGGTNITHTVWGSNHGQMRFGMKLSHIPRDARLCFTTVVCTDTTHKVLEEDASKLLSDSTAGSRRGLKKFAALGSLMGIGQEEEEELPLFYLGWVNMQLFDHKDFLRHGTHSLRMWVGNEKANPIGVVSTSKTDTKSDKEKQLTIMVSLPKYARPVRFPRGQVPQSMRQELVERHKQAMNELEPSLRKNVVNQLRRVRGVIQKDPLYRLESVDKLLLWQFRNDLTQNPSALSKFLQAVDWANPAAVQDALMLLHHPEEEKRWKLPPAGEELVALELLDARYADSKVREYAIMILDMLCDSLLVECILQLVQVLKYEPYHYSALARFLLRRSVKNPHQIGHAVFWHLKAEMSNPAVQERHGLLIEELLKRSPVIVRKGFEKQDALIEMLLRIGIDVKKDKKARERNTRIRQELDSKFEQLINDDTVFTLPLDPRMECSGIIIDKCKVMDSKKLPLWLVFKNADPMGDPIYVIFKAGDDLRQDLLTLQIIAMMDSIWKAQGLDLHMTPYGCVACDDGVGMIEVVLNAETIASITKKAGGAAMAFAEDPMINWLRQQNCNKDEAGVRNCMQNFLHSCAGYCVATYILGIGDRHNDNIMMKMDGTLFHIDFGHFLGNFKTKFGVKRETSPFIFTPMYASVLGGEKSPVYRHFVKVACVAYNIARRSSHIVISLFALMLSTGIPELQKPDDIEWLQKVLMMGEDDDDKSAKNYEENIRDSLNNKRTLFNDYIHIMAH